MPNDLWCVQLGACGFLRGKFSQRLPRQVHLTTMLQPGHLAPPASTILCGLFRIATPGFAFSQSPLSRGMRSSRPLP